MERELKKILYIDDDVDLHNVIQLAIEVIGELKLSISSSGKDGIKEISIFKPDLILLDVNMPEMSGPETLKELQRLHAAKNIPVIFFTTKVTSEREDELIKLGAIKVLNKPFDPMKLAENIKEIWSELPEKDNFDKEPVVETTNEQENVKQKLNALQQEFIKKIPISICEIKECWYRLNLEKWQRQNAETLHHLVHKLAGTSLVYNLPEVGKSAKNCEVLIKKVLNKNCTPDTYAKMIIDEQISGLEKICTKSIKKTEIINKKAEFIKSAALSPYNNKMIYIVENELTQANELETQLGYYGYSTRVFKDFAEFQKTVEKQPPGFVIMSTELPDGNGPELLTEHQINTQPPFPLIIISKKQDLQHRLQTVRAGGIAFFTKPVEIARLVDTLDNYIAGKDLEPYRVLIVEDSKFVAEYYSSTLEKVGMKTEIVIDPLKVMKPLSELRPDLILMDLYMPGCTGIELAKVIRQHEALVSIPIVYLSAETDLSLQLEALSPGGDAFLTKPIKQEHLIKAVSSRVERNRILQSFMIKDSLTGLFNHTRIKEQLDLEIGRINQQSGQLCFVMIDIDKFKSVNDTYGHPTGDRVIKSLARLLKQRLRKIDIIGRYGGEEFAVILPDTSLDKTIQFMDDIRIAFGQITHQHQGVEFSVTFSCGVSCYPKYKDAEKLNDAADQALYSAKENGRNQVVAS
jgi:diguanylate cyclase (GGDEF)-like protein